MKERKEIETFDDNDPKTCRAIIYIESPKFLIPKRLQNSVMERNQEELGTVVGHVFFGIVDEKGKQEILGLHARAVVPGEKENVPESERNMTAKQMAFRSMTGIVLDNSKEPYDDCIVYKISKSQYNKIKEFTEQSKINPPKYNILTSNCVNFTYKALHKAGLKLPPQMFISSPHISALNARAIEKAEKLKDRLSKVAIKLGNWFSDRNLVKLGAKVAQFGVDLVKDTTKAVVGIGVGTVTKLHEAGTSIINFAGSNPKKKNRNHVLRKQSNLLARQKNATR